ncbi:ABC transporter substrate-binding protein [Arthrobacter sp. KK5.5]|uniref:ABC transporter substrate-binding protein n=1 Tax=Arthrobacter sp. KK5.5 TaxID=3373084 RepID=UPI003EE6185B
MQIPNVTLDRRRLLGLGAGAFAAAGLTACGASAGEGATVIVVAIVSNPQMTDAVGLMEDFRSKHPGINVRFVSLPENEARAKITASVATGGGEFDVVMISNYETPMWAENGWLANLTPYMDATAGYDAADFLPTIREALTYEGSQYSVPFYGESSFVVYRQDLFDDAGLTMPEQPTWRDIRTFAERLHAPERDFSGICLRGLAGWGEVMAPLNTVINTYGGRWFDEDWNPQLQSPQVREAVGDYVDLVRSHGQPGAATSGYGDCLTRFAQGNAAMWYDATAMVSSIEDPGSSTVVGKTNYALAPVRDTKSAGWLYTWALAVPESSRNKQAAWDFVSWMTNKDYMHLVGNSLGWERLPPGSRRSTYEIPEYADIASAYAEPTLQAMGNATQENSIVGSVPYEGLQFVGIPEFQDLGTRVAQQISAAIAGNQTVDEALAQAQGFAETVARTYQTEGQA